MTFRLILGDMNPELIGALEHECDRPGRRWLTATVFLACISLKNYTIGKDEAP